MASFNHFATEFSSAKDALYWRNLAAIVLCLFILTRSLGFLFDLPVLELIGRSSYVSPLPLPFHTYNGYENLSTMMEVTLHYHGSKTEIVDLKKLSQDLPGPHRAKIPIVYALWMAPVYPESLLKPIYNKLFCDQANLAQTDEVFYVEVAYISLADQNKQQHYLHLCDLK